MFGKSIGANGEDLCKVISYRSSPPRGALFSLLVCLEFNPASLWWGVSRTADYDPMARPISLIIGTLYSLLAGAVAGALFGWLYNSFVERF